MIMNDNVLETNGTSKMLDVTKADMIKTGKLRSRSHQDLNRKIKSLKDPFFLAKNSIWA